MGHRHEHRRHLAVLLVLWYGSNRGNRAGFSRCSVGFGQGYIAKLIPKRWGDTYSRRTVQDSIRWLHDREIVHVHQPPDADTFACRGQRDPLPPAHRGPSGQAYNQHWFPAELARGPSGRNHRRGGLWGFEADLRAYLLDDATGVETVELRDVHEHGAVEARPMPADPGAAAMLAAALRAPP